MKYERRLVVIVLVLVILILTACGSSEPPGEDVVTDLLNQRDGVEEEYTFLNMNSCMVEPDEVDIEEVWGVFYTPAGGSEADKEWVRVVKGTDGQWSISDKDHCQVR
jgi:predicted small secreted protein